MAVKNKQIPEGLDGNINLGYSVKKKRFSVGGDPNLVIEFDPSDLGVTSRLSKALPKFNELNDKWDELNTVAEKAQDLEESDDMGEALSTANDFSRQFDEIEKDVRKLIDEVFDAEISDKLLGNSCSFSPVNGFFKYEHIITALLNCYEKHIQDEAPKFNSRKTQKYTHKYIKR